MIINCTGFFFSLFVRNVQFYKSNFQLIKFYFNCNELFQIKLNNYSMINWRNANES